MHVSRYKRLLSHSKGIEAFHVHVLFFAPVKIGYDFFEVKFTTGDMTVYCEGFYILKPRILRPLDGLGLHCIFAANRP